MPPAYLSSHEDDVTIDPLEFSSDLLPFNTYHYGRCGYHTLKRELVNTFQGTPKAVYENKEDLDDIFDSLYHNWKSYVGEYQPLSWETVIDSKDKNTSLGYPLCFYFTNMGDLLDISEEGSGFSVEELVSELQSMEDSLLRDGSLPIAVWRPFPKVDKYSTTKVQQNKFRLVSVGPFFLLSLCKRYFQELVHTLEVAVRQFFLVTGNEEYVEKVVCRLLNGYSWGVDYTAFDKNSTSYLTTAGFMLLDRLSGYVVPRPIVRYIVLSICQPVSMIISPTGIPEIYCLGSSNPSGQFFTSYTNSVTHLVHNMLFCSKYYNATHTDYLQDEAPMRSIMTGDDGIDVVANFNEAETTSVALTNFLDEYFNIPAKIDQLELLDGSKVPFPPGVLPVYLNKILITLDGDEGSMYLIPSNPRRFIPRLLFLQTSDIHGSVEETMEQRVTGILQEIKPNILHEYLYPHFPKNSVVDAIKKFATKLGLVPLKPQLITQEVLLPRAVKLL